MTRKLPVLGSLAVIGLLLVGAASLWWLSSSRQPTIPEARVETESLHEAIRLSADYLIGACGDDGKLVYRVNLDLDLTYPPRYNIVRHAGTMYAMGMCQQWDARDRMRAAIVRAGNFLKQNALRPLPENADLLAVWSDPKVTGYKEPLQVKLGGAGLGLVALVSLEKAQPGATPLEDLRRLGRFLLFMQIEDGSFHDRFVPAEGGFRDENPCLYYPGEAALGLAMLAELDPQSPEWFEASVKAISCLARIRKGKRSVEPDHWALLATAELFALADRRKQPIPREALLEHAVQICERMLAGLPRRAPHSRAVGCLTGGSRTCPTATRLEGLLAALTFLPKENRALREQLAAATTAGTSFLLGSQIRKGRYAGAIPGEVLPPPSEASPSDEPDDREATEVRIDYVQHALSAMIRYDRVFSNSQSGKSPAASP